jgi:hypothetical protein
MEELETQSIISNVKAMMSGVAQKSEFHHESRIKMKTHFHYLSFAGTLEQEFKKQTTLFFWEQEAK